MKQCTLNRYMLTVLFSSVFVYAQGSNGSITGTITDANGASVPAATVEAKEKNTGLVLKMHSTEEGLYTFPTLPVGTYNITVEKSGFKKLTRSDVPVNTGARVSMDLKLEVGDVTQSVDVTAEAPLLEATSSEKASNFTPKFMANLPLFTGGIRSAQSFVGYMPGVNNNREMSISGSGGRGAEVQIDGASLIIPESGGAVFNFPGSEAFGEFKLTTGTYSAELGRFGGGVQQFSSKSGTNDFHGALFWYLRRDIFNANAWSNNAAGRGRPKERFNEGGFAAGGPVWIPKVYDGRNKTFFYVTLSRDLRPATISPTIDTVPTAQMRGGDFSQLATGIYDPLTTVGTTRQLFPNNQIPASRISKVATGFLPALPSPNLAGFANNYAFVNQSAVKDRVFTYKIDHNFSSNNRLAFFHTMQNQDTQNVTAFDGPLGQGLGSNFQKPFNVRANHDLVIRPTILLHSTFGYSSTIQGWDNPAQRGFASKVGLGVPTDATPRVVFSSADAYTPWGVQDGKVNNGGQNNYTYHFNQTLSVLKGKHSMKFGWDIRRLQTYAFDAAGTNGRFAFERAQTALPTNTAGSGNSFASFLLGLPNDVQFSTLPYPDPWIKYGYHAGFFQDDWRVTPKLTLNVGIRYEVPIGYHMANYQFSMVDLKLPNAAAGGLPGAMIYAGNGVGRTGTKRFYPTDFSNLGPRAGFAYQLTSKTVVRGGYGIFYQTLGNGGCGCQLGFGGIPGQILGNGVEAALQWDTGFRIPQGAKPPFIDPTAFNFQNVDHLGDNFGKAPRVQNWSFNIQHEVKKFLIDVGYVGNRANRLASTLYINQVDPKYLSLGSLLRLPISDPQVVAAGFKKPFASFPDNQPLAQALRPYPQYFNIADRNAGVGRTWYDSLQVMVIRRFGFWQTQTSYVRSKSQTFLHYRQIFSQTQTSPQNNYDLSDSKTYLPFDQPNFFNSLNTFDLPFGRGKKYLSNSGRGLDTIVGGWTIGFIAQYRSGTLIDVAPPNTLNNGTLFTQFKKANATGVPVRTSVDRRDIDPANPQARYFGCNAVPLPTNPNAFTCAAGSTPFVAPGEFEFGNVSQFIGNFRQPPLFTENMSILKRFTLFPMRNDGGLKFTYSANIFNLFNRTNFGVNGAIGNADFGRASGAQNAARLITMGLRLEF